MSNAKKTATKMARKKPHNYKGRERSREAKDELEKTAPNDPFWYGTTPEIVRDTASLSYGYPIGNAIDTDNLDSNQVPYPNSDTILTPGVMSLWIAPSIGVATDANAPVNIASRNIYSFVRHANSGHNNYDSPDLMLMLLAMDQLFSMYSWGTRIYGLLRVYNHVNRYWPDAILASENIDVDSFRSNIANFRYYLDIVAKKIGSMCVPNVMPYFKRHIQCFEGVYSDAPVLKGQLYLYTPKSFWKYDEYNGAGRLIDAGDLRPAADNYKCTFDNFKKVMNAMIDAVVSSEDLNIMSGDILKAFGSDQLVKLNMVPIEYETPITYSPEMLSQIQNATITPLPAIGVSQDATNSFLVFNPTAVTKPILDQRKVLTMTKEDVSPLDTIVATRLSAIMVPSTSNMWVADSLGSEYVVRANLVFFESNGSLTVDAIYHWGVEIDYNNPTTSAARLALIGAIEKFNQHPLIYINEAETYILARLQDIDNYTIVEKEELNEMNQGALLSMFNVPQLGLWAAKST